MTSGRILLVCALVLAPVPVAAEFIFPASVIMRGSGWRLEVISGDLVKCGVRLERTAIKSASELKRVTAFANDPHALDGGVKLNKCGEEVLAKHNRKIGITRRKAQYD